VFCKKLISPLFPSISEIEARLQALIQKHKDELTAELEGDGVNYSRNLDPWLSIYSYVNAEYRDSDGRYVLPEEARERNARIWLWSDDKPSMPANKQAASTKDPGSHNYRFYRPKHPVTGKECPCPKQGWAFPRQPDPDAPGRPNFEALDLDHRIVYGPTEKKSPRIKKFLREVEQNVPKTVIHDYTAGEKELANIFGETNVFPNPKPTTLAARLTCQVTRPGEWVMDFFAGSGTTAHSLLALEQPRRFLLSEMGAYFDAVTKPRIARLMFSPHWKDGEPGALHRRRHIVKVQRFEQYEDVVNNLETAWDDATMPPGVPLRYLFRPEENRVRQSLNLAQPFSNVLRAGKQGEDCAVDLLETWALLQGYWVRSRKVLWQDGKRYAALETECGCLVLLRDITLEEDDSAAVNAIAQSYANADGSPRIQRLELNHWADLRRIALPCTLLMPTDFDRGADWS